MSKSTEKLEIVRSIVEEFQGALEKNNLLGNINEINIDWKLVDQDLVCPTLNIKMK